MCLSALAASGSFDVSLAGRSSLGVGNYRHEPHLVRPEDIRNDQDSPAELPFDMSVMEPGLREARRLLPSLAGFKISDKVYGMFSFTPDAQSIVGEVASVRGLWTAIAVWVTHAAGTGRAVAQQMLTDVRPRSTGIGRQPVRPASRLQVLHSGAGWSAVSRGLRHHPSQIPDFQSARLAAGAVVCTSTSVRGTVLRVERLGASAVVRVERIVANPIAGLSTRPVVRHGVVAYLRRRARCHPPAAGLFDLSTFMRIEVSGPDALKALEYVSCSRIDRPVGRVVYSLLLNERGGIESDVTIARVGEDRFMIMTGSASGPRDLDGYGG